LELFLQYALTASKYVLIILSFAIVIRCLRSMLSDKYEPEVWAYIRIGKETLPVNHWENILGRSKSADVCIMREKVSKVHAVLVRNDRGQWKIYDIFSKGGVWVNELRVGALGYELSHGDEINFAGHRMHFLNVDVEKRRKLEAKRTSAGQRVSPLVTLVELSIFELFLLLQHSLSCKSEYLAAIALAFAFLILLQWGCYFAMRVINRSGFEIEILAFYLTALGLSIAASSVPEDMYKHVLLIAASVLLFLISGWWLRNLRRTAAVRGLFAVLAVGLLALNVLTSEEIYGARNWLEFGGYSFQPSEFVKAAYIYVGASTLDRLYRKRNLFVFIAFSAICVVALALMGDFGTALIFFVSFLVISFMRSGSLATVLLAVSGAGLAGFLAVSVKPYIAERFAIWGHVWEDVYDRGYQQVRAMSAAASGGLFGKGAGNGWLHSVFAADTDMVFAVLCEELGLIIAICAVLALLAIAFFATRSARHARSSYYAIAACATMSMLLVQLALNVFGALDILPFTGVTFPFVSRGGSSLISCWILMSFIKGADNRRGASFAVSTAMKDYAAEEVKDYEED